MNNILTFKKHRFNPLRPTVADIDIADIAHCLARIPRANGHFAEFFPVARHSVNCAAEAKARGLNDNIILTLLLHDASEAYLCDIVRPVKNEMPEYRVYEKVLQDTIYKAYNIGVADVSAIRDEIDDAMLYYEFVHFADERLFDTAPVISSAPDFSECNFDKDEQLFLYWFDKYYKA
ncbi:MAG: phosphohydrolase [Oscillospiraceae bacterium]|jgi:hypothetical protein|nr:phosphohydrolase [Oscillospiraceae bacterium]